MGEHCAAGGETSVQASPNHLFEVLRAYVPLEATAAFVDELFTSTVNTYEGHTSQTTHAFETFAWMNDIDVRRDAFVLIGWPRQYLVAGSDAA